MKLPGDAKWPQGGLEEPGKAKPQVPLNQAEARKRMEIAVRIMKIDDTIKELAQARAFLVERLQQHPEKN